MPRAPEKGEKDYESKKGGKKKKFEVEAVLTPRKTWPEEQRELEGGEEEKRGKTSQREKGPYSIPECRSRCRAKKKKGGDDPRDPLRKEVSEKKRAQNAKKGPTNQPFRGKKVPPQKKKSATRSKKKKGGG